MTSCIKIYIFNVGAGDSIIIEFVPEDNNDRSKYVVVDSNLIKINNNYVNPAFNFLLSQNVSKISTLVVTHLHKDHYNGVEDFINNFEIEKIVIPPFLSSNSLQYKKVINKISNKVAETLEFTNDDEVVKSLNSLAHLLRFIVKNNNKVEEASGKETSLRFPGILDFTGTIYLPLKRIKGILHHKLLDPDSDLNLYPDLNDSSIAFSLNCFGHELLLSGDSTLSQWSEHKRQMKRDNIENLNINFLKTPHHGSKHNNDDDLYSYLLKRDDVEKYLFTSANGVSNPDVEIFGLVTKFSLTPYCTNFSKHCLPSNVYLLNPMPALPRKMKTFLLNYVENEPIPCQGDIQITIGIESKVSVSSSTKTPCIYRTQIGH